MTPWGWKTITVNDSSLWNWMLLLLLPLHPLFHPSDIGEIILSKGDSLSIVITPNDITFRIIDIAFSVQWQGEEIISLIKHQDFTSILDSFGKSESSNPLSFCLNSELFSMCLFGLFLLFRYGHIPVDLTLVWSVKDIWSSLTLKGLATPL